MRGSPKVAAAVLLATLLFAPSAFASEGDLDPSFGRRGVAVLGTDGGNVVSSLSDGSVVVGTLDSVTRLAKDGVNDVGFEERSAQAVAAVGYKPLVADLEGSGSQTYVAVRTLTDRGVPSAVTLIRLAADGSRDPSFAQFTIPIVNQYAGSAVAFSPQGVVVGAGNTVARVGADGAPDPAFSGDGLAEIPLPLEELDVKSDGSIVYSTGGTLSQLTPAGSPDPAFADIQGGTAGLGGITVDGQDNTYFMTANSGGLYPGCEGAVRKVGPDGAGLPGGFKSSGCPAAETVAVDAQNRPVSAYTGGAFENPDYFLVRRATSTGTPDPSFGDVAGSVRLYPNGCTSDADAVTLDTNGRIIVTARVCGKVGVLRLLASQQGSDHDADGVTDRRDRCDLLPAKPHRGCPAVKSTLTVLSNKGGNLLGEIDSDEIPYERAGSRIPPPDIIEPWCSVARRVVAYLVQPGRDRVVAKATTGEAGNWLMRRIGVEGRIRLTVRGEYSSDGYCTADKVKATLR